MAVTYNTLYLAEVCTEVRNPNRIANALRSYSQVPTRFTIDGDATLENHLAELCESVRQEVQTLIPESKLEGLLLGGGYGRGEGGVLKTQTADRAYNDLEFYVFVRGNPFLMERRYRSALAALGRKLSPAAGLDIEFKVMTLQKLRQSPPSMFYYDLVLGHRWIIGDDSLLAGCEHHREASKIPLHQATRLLMNRCSGLLFAAERLLRAAFTPDDADFVARNLAKAQLALGDVLLTACGLYHWSCRERQKRLTELQPISKGQWWGAVRQHHAAGVAFKLHPNRSDASRETLQARHASISAAARQLWLWLENLRLETAFASPRRYALSLANKCPETHALRNRLITAVHLGLGEAMGSRGAAYPRQRLFHALCLLLWVAEPLRHEASLRRIQRELNTKSDTFPELVSTYAQLWHLFN